MKIQQILFLVGYNYGEFNWKLQKTIPKSHTLVQNLYLTSSSEKLKQNLQHVTKRMVSSVEHFDHWEGM